MTIQTSWLVLAATAAALVIGIAFARETWIDAKVRAAYGEDAPYSRQSLPAQDGRPVILLLGDSRMAQWPIDDRFVPWQVFNRGVAGETSRQLAHRFATELSRVKPQAVILSTGINDIVGISFMPPPAEQAAVDALVAAFRLMADQALADNVPLLVTTIIPPSRPSLLRRLVWSPRTTEIVTAVNSRLRSTMWPSNTTLSDIAELFPHSGDGLLDDRYRKDTLHLNAAAYTALQQSIFSALTRMPLRPARLP